MKIFKVALLIALPVILSGCSEKLRIASPVGPQIAITSTNERDDPIESYYFDGIIGQDFIFVVMFRWHHNKGSVDVTLYDLRASKDPVHSCETFKIETDAFQKGYLIRMGNNYIEGENSYGNDVYRVRVKNDLFDIHLVLEPEVDNYGIFKERRGVSSVITFKNPRMKITTARILCGDKTYEGQGEGYYEYLCFPRSFRNFILEGWYWSRFYTRNYTVVLTQFSRGRMYLVVYKNNTLIHSFLGKDNDSIFSQSIPGYQKLPSMIEFVRDSYHILLSHHPLTTDDYGYARYITDVKLRIGNEISGITEYGTGISELIPSAAIRNYNRQKDRED